MENYIHINGQKIILTKEQVEKVKESFSICRKTLSSINVGDTFTIGEHAFIVLEHSRETTAVIRKDILCYMEFGKNNNFDGSAVDAKCSEFAAEIAGIIGLTNIVTHTVDLISDDGLKCYGEAKRKASLLTTELYRRYVDVLDKYKPKKWWWLATAFSTKRHNDESLVKCVSPAGIIGNGGCNCGYFGVRPFLILKSNIFVSK